MILFPNCKINLGLRILDKRPDGYHNLETIFFPIPFNDILEIIAGDEKADPIQFSQSGIPIEGRTEDNLCVKACELIRKQFPELPSIRMHLHKAVPSGAGLGGGSSDGAHALMLLNDKFQLRLTTGQLTELALQLGSDSPFFVINKACMATGRGEELEKISLDLSDYHFVLVYPRIHINTGWAFTQFKPANTKAMKSLAEIIQQPVESWKNSLQNDFEEAVFGQYPAINSIKQQLYQQGAIYASMSGSGSTVFGIYRQNPPASFDFPDDYLVKTI